jgi:hypothetical protein
VKLARRARDRAPGLEALPVGQRQALVEDLLERSAVVCLTEGIAIRHLLGPDHVSPLQMGAVEPHLARGGVHQPLEDVDRLRPPGAAVRAAGRVLGRHRTEP